MDIDTLIPALRTLDDDGAGPPRVDLTAAVARGRQLRRSRRLARATLSASLVAITAAALVAAPRLLHRPEHGVAALPGGASPSAVGTDSPRPLQSLSCDLQQLAVPVAGQQSIVRAADPTGRYIVGRVYTGGTPNKVVVWDNGQPHPATMHGSDATLDDINSSGVAVGSSFLTDTSQVPWVYANDQFTRLAGAGPMLAPTAINEQGEIVGVLTDAQYLTHPVVWRSPTASLQNLPLPSPGWIGGAGDIDTDGTIIGSGRSIVDSGAEQGVVWLPDGTVRVLPLPEITGANGLRLMSIRHGIIAGEAIVSDAKSMAFFPVTYDLATGVYTQRTGARFFLNAGNAQGWLVGSGPSLWTPQTGMIALPRLSDSNILPDEAYTISDDGSVIAGQLTDAKNVIHAVTWHCH